MHFPIIKENISLQDSLISVFFLFVIAREHNGNALYPFLQNSWLLSGLGETGLSPTWLLAKMTYFLVT